MIGQSLDILDMVAQVTVLYYKNCHFGNHVNNYRFMYRLFEGWSNCYVLNLTHPFPPSPSATLVTVAVVVDSVLKVGDPRPVLISIPIVTRCWFTWGRYQTRQVLGRS